MKKSGISTRVLIGIPFLICVSPFFEGALIAFWYRFMGLTLFDTIESSVFYDCISTGALALFILFCFNIEHNVPKRIGALFCIYTIIYLEFRFLGNDEYTLVYFHWKVLSRVAYSDIVPIAMAFYAVTARNNKPVKVHNDNIPKSLYFEDTTNVTDLLGHKNQAETIANIVKVEYANSQNAVGIAITGEWGAGKSTFLSYLNDSLKDCICINFDPWSESSTNVIYDLLDRIEHGISQKDTGLGKTFRRYVEKVHVTNVTSWFGLVVLAIRNFFDHETESQRRTNLKEALKVQKKPIVVFIDDSDRLPNDLFLKVISVIRGIGDFPNLVFIVAFDQQRANNKLKDSGGQDFMCKLFNVIHPLQPIDDAVLENELISNVSEILIDNPQNIESFKEIAREALSGISIKSYLPTLREMKRFSNIVEKDYCLIKDKDILQFLDLRQWLKVELLKFTDISVYYMIATYPEVYLNKVELFGLNSPYYVLKSDAVFSMKETKILLDALFHQELGQQNDTFLISNPFYFGLYFSGRLPENYVKSSTIRELSIMDGDNDDVCQRKSDNLKVFIHENWPCHNTTNIESAVSEILKTYPADLLYPILETIAKEYIAYRKGSTLKELGERDEYRKYANVIREHPYLSVLSFCKLEDFCEFDGHKTADDACILKSNNPLILCAIFNNQIRNWDYDGRVASDGYLFTLLKRLVYEGKHHEVIWAIADCNSADLQESFLSTYLQEHFLDSLPYLLCHYKNPYTNENQIYADIPAIEGLFLSYKGFKKKMSKLKWSKSYDENLLNELCRLVDLSNYIEIHDEYFKVEFFPLLKAYLDESKTLLSKSHIKSNSFWTDGDRIEKVVEYSFG